MAFDRIEPIFVESGGDVMVLARSMAILPLGLKDRVLLNGHRTIVFRRGGANLRCGNIVGAGRTSLRFKGVPLGCLPTVKMPRAS